MTTTSDSTRATAQVVADELAVEQLHVDRVYTELAKASERAKLVAAEGMARGRTERTGEARDEEMTGLFERDALVFHAARRQHALDTQYEGLVFGRLDLEHQVGEGHNVGQGHHVGQGHNVGQGHPADATGSDPQQAPATEREVRYIGRLGIRDEHYEPLVMDWRAPAAAPFYRATPVEPLGVLRRRVLRCRGSVVVGIEDDLMVPDPPDDLVVVGDGALMAALTRSRGAQMRDIVATIQRHQDEAIRAPARGVTEITGGPGTGKTVVALHRAAYLLYSDRRRYESGGILVVGPSGAYTAYIERVLPSLGEDSVSLRALGDLVDAFTTERHDPPATAAIKGSLRIREVLARAARDLSPDAPHELRVFAGGYAVRLDAAALDRVRAQALRQHPRNLAVPAAAALLAEAAYRAVRPTERENFLARFGDHPDVESFLAAWWPQVDPREVLLWLADAERMSRYAAGVLTPEEAELVRASLAVALETGSWSISDVPLVDDLAARVGPVQQEVESERGFYEIEELETLAQAALPEVYRSAEGAPSSQSHRVSADPRERLLAGTIGRVPEYAHVLVDEAQDLSPMQWRLLGRRGRYASWTVVGDLAQSSWPDPVEAAAAREQAWGGQAYRRFHMTTNYRNAREIFDYAAAMIRRYVPDADIPDAVRQSGAVPVEEALGDDVVGAVERAVAGLAGQVEGTIAVITPDRYAVSLGGVVARLHQVDPAVAARVRVIDPLSTKGLEYDATVVVDPDEIGASCAGGVRTAYVVLTRAAHRMVVLLAPSRR